MAEEIKITKDSLHDYYAGYDHFFPEGAPVNDTPYLKWKRLKEFTDEVAKLTGINISAGNRKAINDSQQVLEKLAKNEVEGNMPTQEALDTEVAAKREEARQKAIKESNDAVRRMIAKQNEIYAKLQATKPKIFVKADTPQTPELSEKGRSFLNNNLKKNPSIPYIADQIEKSLSPSLQNQLTKEQIHLIALDSAYKAVDAASHPEKYIESARQTAILYAVAKDNTALPKVITDKDILDNIRIGANELSTFDSLQTQFPRAVWDAFEPGLGKTLFPSPDGYQIGLSETQLPGYTSAFSPDGMTKGYTVFLENNAAFFGKLTRLPVDRFQHELMAKSSAWLEGQIVKNFPSSAAFFSSPESQLLLRGVGIGTTTIELPASFSTFFIENPGSLPVVNFFSRGMGVSFEVGGGIVGGVAASTMTAATAESIAATGGIMASEAFLGGAGVAAAGAAGQAVIPIPVVGAVIGAVAGAAAPKFIKLVKDNAKNIGKAAISVLGGAIGFVLGGGTLFSTLIGVGGGYLTGAMVTGGIPGVSTALSSAASAAGTVVSVVWATALAGIGAPILGFLIGFPILVIFILFIINSGAYVVPPGQQFLNETNAYIGVEKTANPSGQVVSPTSITYTVKITAKKDPLTGISISSDCKAIKKGTTLDCPAEQIPAPPASINPGTPFTFTFTSNYGGRYQDSLVSNTITVSGISSEGGKQSDIGSSSVCFGKCPLDCFDFTDSSWNQVPSIKSQYMSAASTIAGKYPNFAIKVCKAGAVKLVYSTNDPAPGNCSNIYGRNISNTQINFNKCASQVGGQQGVLYILAHEVTHHIQYTNGYWFTLYKDKVPPSEWDICTYGQGDASEQMAEADALFIANPVIYTNPCGVSTSNFRSKYPLNYNFVKNYMYAP